MTNSLTGGGSLRVYWESRDGKKQKKLHWQNFEREKLVHGKSAKNAKPVQKLAKMTKISQKKGKTHYKIAWKSKN